MNNDQKYRSIFNAIGKALAIVEIIYDAAGNAVDLEFVEINPAHAKQEGLDYTGRLALQAGLSAELYQPALYEPVLATGQPLRFECHVKRTDRWFEIFALRLAPKQVAIVFNDITGRKMAEATLRAHTEERYMQQLEQAVDTRTAGLKESTHLVQRITETMPDMVSVMAWPSRNVLYTNRDPFINQGFDAALMEKQTLKERSDHIHPDDMRVLRQYYSRFDSLHEEELAQCDYRAVNNRGEWMWFRVRGRVFERDAQGSIKSIINVVQNISDLKMAEAQVKEKLHFVNQVALTIPDMLTVMELDTHNIVYANTKPFLENGFDADRLSNISVQERALIIYPDDLQAVRDYFRNFKSYSDDKMQSIEYRARTDSGEWMWFRVRGKVFKRDEQGVPIQCVNIVQNINSLKVAEQQLIELKLQQQKEILNAIIHAQEEERARIGEALHNGVAQLLYAIQTRLQLLTPASPDDGTNLQAIQNIVVDAIKDTRGISFELVPAVLVDYGVETALQSLVQKVVPARIQVEIRSALKERLPEKTEFSVFRIMQELLNNIVKHSQASSALLEITLLRKYLTIKVEDNGQGFNQRDIKGMHKGIGLQSIRNRVKLLEGTMKITSAPGHTLMLIRLPINMGA